jgi:hypothetical protein
VVYFVQAVDGGPIKIGTSIRLTERLRSLARDAGKELCVLAVVDGSYGEERSLHRRFAHLNVVNELFEPGADLLGFIVEAGREWDGTDDVPPKNDVSVKMDAKVVEECRIASAFKGMSLAEYLSETMRVAAKKDIDESVARRAQESSQSKSKGGPK